jgi:hypothetical protein
MDFVGETLLEQLSATLGGRLPRGRNGSFSRLARESLQIRTMDNRVIPFVLRPLQKRYLAYKRLARARDSRPRFLLLKYRRGGFTTLEQGLSYYMATRRRNVTVMTLAQDSDTTQRIFRIARLMHERDPRAPRIKGPGNQYRLEFPGLNSLFYVDTAGAHGVARGDTLSRVHWSEVAHSCLGFNQRDKQRDLLAGMSEAASEGEMVLETTPNGSELFRELYVEAKQGKNDWTAIFLPWFADIRNRDPVTTEEAAELLAKPRNDDEVRAVKVGGLDGSQVKWRRRKQRELKHLFAQEHPEDDETCWLVSGTPYFNPQAVMHLRDFCQSQPLIDDPDLGMRPGDSRSLPAGWEVEWPSRRKDGTIAVGPEKGILYCVGVDTSEGLPGCDHNGLGVMRRDTGQQVASLHGLFDPRTLAAHAVRIARRYNDALLGIERENHGHAVIQKVIDLGYHQPHHRGGSLYHHSVAKAAKAGDRPIERAGWSTNALTRPVMLEGLREWIEEEGALERCYDRHFLGECMTFRMQANGKFGADSGCHDDSVIKWAIANQMRSADWRRKQLTIHNVSRWTK